MTNLWSTLLPLIIGGAVVPIQLVVTILLLRSSSGRITSLAWVGGMTTVRLLQGLLFGFVVGASVTSSSDSDGTSTFASVVLLLVGLLFLVAAGRQAFGQQDPDDPPPKWLTATATMTPGRAFLLGSALMLVGIKFWVFTLSALTAIDDAGLSQAYAVATFLLFVLLTESVHLTILGVAYAAPGRSDALLESAADWLERQNRVIMIALGVVFGTWFVVKALTGLGVL